MVVTHRLGELLLPEGIFSAAAIAPTTWIGRRASHKARIVPSTEAAPHIKLHFIHAKSWF